MGIDGAPCAPLPDGVIDMVARPEELERLSRLPSSHVDWQSLLFSAKESVFKAWHPLTGRAL
ncbi:MAG: 4'-phosphopantetheinyl transferase superfamily protein [Acidothermales bacterium]|nr:4'-phosphopantetheinyl transferase superfamily protein [Acidothermales bacterium]